MEVVENIDDEEKNKEDATTTNQESQKENNEQALYMIKVRNTKYLRKWNKYETGKTTRI